MLHLVPPQPVFVDGSKTPREYTVEIVVATGGLLTHVTTMGMGRVSMKTPERAQQPPTNFPGKIYENGHNDYLSIYLFFVITQERFGVELVSHRGDGHQGPPEGLYKGPDVAGMVDLSSPVLARHVLKG